MRNGALVGDQEKLDDLFTLEQPEGISFLPDIGNFFLVEDCPHDPLIDTMSEANERGRFRRGHADSMPRNFLDPMLDRNGHSLLHSDRQKSPPKLPVTGK